MVRFNTMTDHGFPFFSDRRGSGYWGKMPSRHNAGLLWHVTALNVCVRAVSGSLEHIFDILLCSFSCPEMHRIRVTAKTLECSG